MWLLLILSWVLLIAGGMALGGLVEHRRAHARSRRVQALVASARRGVGHVA